MTPQQYRFKFMECCVCRYTEIQLLSVQSSLLMQTCYFCNRFLRRRTQEIIDAVVLIKYRNEPQPTHAFDSPRINGHLLRTLFRC